MFGKFSFNAVGQGLFYSGRIEMDKMKFNIVYDCGAMPKDGFIGRAISYYNNEYCGEDIDLLIISHFDVDHFNGIPDLLRKHRVKVVVVPYLTVMDRVLLGLSVINNKMDEDEKKKLVNIYYDPIEYLYNHADNIVVLYGEDGFREDDENTEKEFPRGESLGYRPHEWSIFTNKKGRQWFVRNNTTLKIHLNDWEFIFYNKHTQTSDVDNYVRALESALQSNKRTICELHEMMRDYKKFVAFKNKIKSVMPQKNMNDNSVIMYHGPIYNNYNDKPDCILAENILRSNRIYEDSNLRRMCRCGTLLTGDYSKFDTDWQEIVDAIGENRVKRVGHFQVPHHGARSSFKRYDEFDCCIISYGTKNTYGHPNKDVLNIIARSDTLLRLVSEWQDYSYYISD